MPVRAAWETLRLVRAHRASSSARRWPAWRRTPGSAQAPVRRARATVADRSSKASSRSPTKAVPRSKLRVTMVTRQPSFSSPTRLATGTRTSSRKSSANSVEPAMVRQGADLHPGRVHGQDQPRDAPVAAVLRPGPDQQLAVVGHLGVRGPDLRAGDDVVVAVADGPGAHGGQVDAGVGLGEALAPDLVALEDGGQVPLALFGRPLGDDGGAGVEEADEVHPDVGGVGPLELLLEDQLLDRGRAPAPAFDRPVDPGVAGVEEQPLPVGVVGAAARPVGGRRAWAAGRAASRPATGAALPGTPARRRCSGGPRDGLPGVGVHAPGGPGAPGPSVRRGPGCPAHLKSRP